MHPRVVLHQEINGHPKPGSVALVFASQSYGNEDGWFGLGAKDDSVDSVAQTTALPDLLNAKNDVHATLFV